MSADLMILTQPKKLRSQETFRIIAFNEGVSLDYSGSSETLIAQTLQRI
jgi:hypothetical protein